MSELIAHGPALVFLMPERLVERRCAGSHAQERDMKSMSGSSVMVGIDVASAHVDVAAIGGELPAALSHVGNDAEGIARWPTGWRA